MSVAPNRTVGEPTRRNDSAHPTSAENVAGSIADPTVNECCPPATHNTCCEPSAKPGCCGAVKNGCGCR